MRFLFISEDLIGGNLAYKLTAEGHDVKLCILEKEREENFENIVQKCSDWKDELSWVGKDGIVVFDYVGDGEVQDALRNEGYAVFGGGSKGEELELNRQSTQEFFVSLGMDTAPSFDFSNIEEAIAFIKKHPVAWVVKKNYVATNSISYVGMLPNGEDVIDVLTSYRKHNKENIAKITLQQKVEGVEIAIARFFNGDTWVSPIEINIEHNPFMAGDIGLSTSEMGTIAWHTHNEKNKLFKRTLEKLAPYLKEINYRGVIDINCIVNKEGIFPLEVTARMGSPIAHLQSEMLLSGWGELLNACARGLPYKSNWKKGFGIVVFVTTPPFPYSKYLAEYNPKGQHIYFDMPEQEISEHVHFEDVAFDTVNNNYVISDTRGYILYVTACKKIMRGAQKMVYDRIQKITFPKMMYRNDIGTRFIEQDYKQLRKWGYLK